MYTFLGVLQLAIRAFLAKIKNTSLHVIDHSCLSKSFIYYLCFFLALVTLYLFSMSRHVPNHASKEVLVIMGSLTSCDPGNIFVVIDVRTCTYRLLFVCCCLLLFGGGGSV